MRVDHSLIRLVHHVVVGVAIAQDTILLNCCNHRLVELGEVGVA